MSNALTDAKNELADALNTVDGMQAWAYMPEHITAPAAVVFPEPGGNDYVSAGTAMAEYRATLMVRVFAWASDSAVVTEALDGLIVSVGAALTAHGFSNWQVGSPAVDRDTYNAAYLAVDITIENIFFKEDN